MRDDYKDYERTFANTSLTVEPIANSTASSTKLMNVQVATN